MAVCRRKGQAIGTAKHGGRVMVWALLALFLGVSIAGCVTTDQGASPSSGRRGTGCADPFAYECSPGGGWKGGMGP